MSTLVLTRGAPGSGKSSWAMSWVNDDPAWRVRVNRDDLRFTTYGAYVLDRIREDKITLLQRAAVETALKAGLSVVVDDTNLRAATVRDWYAIADKFGAEVEFADFDTPVEVCIERNNARAAAGGRDVPEAVIRSFFQRYYRKGALPEIPERLESQDQVRVPYEADVSLPQAIIVDIDGTLADMSGNGRSPYDYTRVDEDDVIENVANIIRRLYHSGVTVIVMSGREDYCREKTEQWLSKKAGVVFDHLYMRKTDDGRKDSIVKYELFDQNVRNNFNVIGVFDDRKQVAYMWEEIGLTLFKVGPIDADF